MNTLSFVVVLALTVCGASAQSDASFRLMSVRRCTDFVSEKPPLMNLTNLLVNINGFIEGSVEVFQEITSPFSANITITHKNAAETLSIDYFGVDDECGNRADKAQFPQAPILHAMFAKTGGVCPIPEGTYDVTGTSINPEAGSYVVNHEYQFMMIFNSNGCETCADFRGEGIPS